MYVSHTRSQQREVLGCEGFVFQVVGLQEPNECISKQERIVPVVESPFQFIQVGIQVFDLNLMKRTDDRPLKETPDVLYGVGVDISHWTSRSH